MANTIPQTGGQNLQVHPAAHSGLTPFTDHRMTPNREPRHVPVMAQELVRLLGPRPGQVWVDCTVGGGGHSRLIAERLAEPGRLIGLDQDPTMLDLARPHLAGLPVTLVHANFDQCRGLRVFGYRMVTIDGFLAHGEVLHGGTGLGESSSAARRALDRRPPGHAREARCP